MAAVINYSQRRALWIVTIKSIHSKNKRQSDVGYEAECEPWIFLASVTGGNVVLYFSEAWRRGVKSCSESCYRRKTDEVIYSSINGTTPGPTDTSYYISSSRRRGQEVPKKKEKNPGSRAPLLSSHFSSGQNVLTFFFN